MTAIYFLWLREVKRYLRSRPQIIASLAQPLLYLLVLGFGLGAVFQQAGQGSYLRVSFGVARFEWGAARGCGLYEYAAPVSSTRSSESRSPGPP